MTRLTYTKKLPIFALLLWFSLAAVPGRSQELLARPLDIGELTQAAGTIVHGRIVAVQQGTHPDYPNVAVVNVTVQVLRNIRGADAQQITFRQWVQPIRQLGVAKAPARKMRVAAGYTVGQDLVLFLYPPSRYGLTSPVGADQGKFAVLRDASGTHVRNNAGNAVVFGDLQTSARRLGVQVTQSDLTAVKKPAMDLDSFLSLVSRLARSGVAR
jgi:hypothetical protein